MLFQSGKQTNQKSKRKKMISYQLCTKYRWAEESSNFRALLTLILTCERGLLEPELRCTGTLFHERLSSTWGELDGETRSGSIELFHNNIEDLELLVSERVVQLQKRIEEVVLLNRKNKKLCENMEDRETHFI